MYTGKEALSHLPVAKHLYIQTLWNPSSYITKVHHSFTNNNTKWAKQEEQKEVEGEKFF